MNLKKWGYERRKSFYLVPKHHAREGSDMGLFVISSDWKTFGQRERLKELGVAAARILEPIQAQGFTPEEITNKKISPIWQQVIGEKAISI